MRKLFAHKRSPGLAVNSGTTYMDTALLFSVKPSSVLCMKWSKGIHGLSRRISASAAFEPTETEVVVVALMQALLVRL